MLWIKAFHIVFVVSWFAGLFYLPRIYVNLAMAEDTKEIQRLNLMAGKLYRFMTPLAVLALILGIWILGIWLSKGYVIEGWMHVKLALVVVLIAYHLYCGRLLKRFAAGENQRSHVFYRWFNEMPVIVLMLVTILVVVKPF